MIIEYIIANDRGDHLAKSTFDDSNSAQARQFALRARVAWEDGHAVITRQFALRPGGSKLHLEIEAHLIDQED